MVVSELHTYAHTHIAVVTQAIRHTYKKALDYLTLRARGGAVG